MTAYGDRKSLSRPGERKARAAKISTKDAAMILVAVTIGFVAGAYGVAGHMDQATPSVLPTVQFAAFNTGSDGSKFLGHGWSYTEPWGTWTVASKADLHIPLEGRPRSDLRVWIKGRIYPWYAQIKQSVGVSVNGTAVALIKRNYEGDLYGATFTIPAKLATARSPMEIVFDIKNPTTPKSIGDNSDSRELGLGLGSIEIEYEAN